MPDNDPLTHDVIGAAMAVSKTLGSGLLESVYEACFAYELRKRGFEVACQTAVPVRYDGLTFDVGFRIDITVQKAVIVEVKAMTAFHPMHEAQLLTYMRMSGIHKGLLINFWAFPFAKGIRRMVI